MWSYHGHRHSIHVSGNDIYRQPIGAPIVFAAVSWVYFTRFNYTTPLQTAIAFVSVVILMDIFVVSLLINGNFEMFASFLGTWLVFALIFLSTYLTGLAVENRGSRAYQ